MTPVILFKFCICTSTRFQIIIHSLQFQSRITASFSYWNILKAREVHCLCKFSAVANRRIKSGIVHLLEETGSVEMESYCNKFVIFVLRYLIDSILHDQEREREGGGKSSTRLVREVTIHHVQAGRDIFYAYCGNTAVDLDPLPVSRARLTVVELALFE